MIGIYKITNLINGKIYVGQSNNIARRFREHKRKGASSRIPLDIAIQKYGEDNFSFEVVEECKLEELNEKETFYIEQYDSLNAGYNCSEGGEQHSVGSNNGRAKLNEEDVVFIRIAYSNHERQKEVYEHFKDKVTFNTFQGIWQGRSWSHIMPEVFTAENKEYYATQNSLGAKGDASEFTSEEIVQLRTRYVNETAKQIYEDVKHRVAYNTLQAMLWGRTYKDLPIYKKQKKQWINV